MGDVAVIFGTQRCGSNFFLSACRRMEDLTVLGEMYHRGGAFPFRPSPQADFPIKQRLGAALCKMFPEEAQEFLSRWDRDAEFGPAADAAINEALVKFSHKYPNKYFLALRDLAEGRKLLFKIFPEHLDMFQILSILKQQRPKVILLLRNPLETFISYKKLVETKKPQDIDTSELKIMFNKAEYFAYKASLTAYFIAIKQFCEEEWIDLSVSHYEWLHSFDAEAKPEKIREHMSRVFATPIAFDAENANLPLYKQQDKAKSVSQKVLNPAQLPQQPQTLL